MNAFRSTEFILIGVILSFNVLIDCNWAQYVPPIPSIEPLYPKGLRMSILHEDGISLVAYHVKFNEDFNGLEAGTIARDIVRVKNGRWIYEDRSTRLKRGDKIYYWIHVVYDGLGYNLLDQQYDVNEFYNYDGTPVKEDGSNQIACAKQSETWLYDARTQKLDRTEACPNQLIFMENFDTLDKNRWKIIEQFVDAPYYNFAVFMNNEDNVYVQDGILHIKPTLTDDKFGNGFVLDGTLNLEKCTGAHGTAECHRTGIGAYILPPIISGRLNTKPSFSFIYGYIEIRAKLPRGDWIYPVLILEKSEQYSHNSSVHSEIVVAFSNGNPTLRTQNGYDFSGHNLVSGAHAITKAPGLLQDNQINLPRKSNTQLWSEHYHTYALEWKKGYVKTLVDGESYGEQTIPPLYDAPAHITIGLSVGGVVVYPDQSISGGHIKPWKNVGSKIFYDFYQAKTDWINSWRGSDTSLHVDYIKVWTV